MIFDKPQEISDAQIAFPANVSHMMPPMDEIPASLWFKKVEYE